MSFLSHIFGNANSSNVASIGSGKIAGIAACSTTHYQNFTVFTDSAELSKSIDGGHAADVKEGNIQITHEIIIT